MGPFPPIGVSLTLGIGLAILILSMIRSAIPRRLALIAAASFAIVFSAGYAVTARHLPADPAWIQSEFRNLSPERQALMARYFQIRAQSGVQEPVSRNEFRSLLAQIKGAAPHSNEVPAGSDDQFLDHPKPLILLQPVVI